MASPQAAAPTPLRNIQVRTGRTTAGLLCWLCAAYDAAG